MLCIRWEWKDILYYELLPHNQTVNLDKYCSQLNRLKAAIDEKRLELTNWKNVIFHQDSAGLHVSLQTRQKLLQLGWDVLPHLPYSSNLALSDYHLFRSLFRILLMERNLKIWKLVKSIWPSSGRMES